MSDAEDKLTFERADQIMEEFFDNYRYSGHRRWQPRPNRRHDIYVTLEERLSGTDKEVIVRRLEVCERCNASGAEPGSPKPELCTLCNGVGRFRELHQTTSGSVMAENICSRCKGYGQLIEEPCQKCTGYGYIERDTTFKLQIPAGIQLPVQFKFSGEGDANARDGQRGDVTFFVALLVESSSGSANEEDDGSDTYSIDVAVNADTLKKGGELTVATPGGSVDLAIPPGIKSGERFTFAGKGYARTTEDGNYLGRGDLWIYVEQRPFTLWERIKRLFGRKV